MSDLDVQSNILEPLSPLLSGIMRYLDHNLAVVGGLLEQVLNCLDDHATDQHLSVALRGVHQVGDVIRGIRDLLSVPMGDRPGPIDLNQCIHDCVQIARSCWFVGRTSRHSPVSLFVDLHPVPLLFGSAFELKFVLLLLLQYLANAVQPGSALTLRTWTTVQDGRQRVLLELADEPGGVHIGRQEGGLEPAFTSSPLIELELEAIPCFIEETLRRLGGRILAPHPMSGPATLVLAFTLPQMSCRR